MAETPYPKQGRRLPTVLSQEEVSRLINSARNPFDRVLLMTLYATGARRAEVTRLKVSDIDSQRMVIYIQGGKGRKDRDVMLSPILLEALREYWRQWKPKTWLFPGSRAHTAPCPITSKVIWHACHEAALSRHLLQFLPYGKFFLMGSAVWRKDAQRWRRALPTLHYDLAFSRAISRSDGLNDPLRRCGGKIASMASSFSVGSARV